MKSETIEFAIGDIAPKTPKQKLLFDIYRLIHQRIEYALQDGKAGLQNMNGRTAIAMVVTNILVNLLLDSISSKNDISLRLNMIDDVLEEISYLTRELWKTIEADKADTRLAN